MPAPFTVAFLVTYSDDATPRVTRLYHTLEAALSCADAIAAGLGGGTRGVVKLSFVLITGPDAGPHRHTEYVTGYVYECCKPDVALSIDVVPLSFPRPLSCN